MQLNWDLRDSDQVKSELTTGKLMPFGDGFIAKQRLLRDREEGSKDIVNQNLKKGGNLVTYVCAIA